MNSVSMPPFARIIVSFLKPARGISQITAGFSMTCRPLKSTKIYANTSV